MAKYKIEVTDDCIGCGACTAASKNFKLVDDKAKPLKSEVDEIGDNQEAADTCPVNAIKITEIKKK